MEFEDLSDFVSMSYLDLNIVLYRNLSIHRPAKTFLVLKIICEINNHVWGHKFQTFIWSILEKWLFLFILLFLVSNPNKLLMSDSEAGKNGEDGGGWDSEEGFELDETELDSPNLGFVIEPGAGFKWMLALLPTEGVKRDNVGVLQGEGDVWRLSLGSDPLVIILLNE